MVVFENHRVPLANCFLALRWHAESARSARRSQPGPNPAGGNSPRPDGLKNFAFFSVSGYSHSDVMKYIHPEKMEKKFKFPSQLQINIIITIQE